MSGTLGVVGSHRLARESDTKALAAALAREALPGDIVCLVGDLGAGKTSFARAFIRALTTPDQEVPSPTFTIVQTYEAGESLGSLDIWHVDLYRLSDPEEVVELGIEDAFADGIMLVEWPERVPDLWPAKRLEIHFAFCDKPTERSVVLRGDAAWGDRLRRWTLAGAP